MQLGNTLNSKLDYGGVPAINSEGTLENVYWKVEKVGTFWGTGKTDEDLARYIPNLFPVSRQNQVAGTHPRKAFASVTYSKKNNLEFVIKLAANIYTNYNSMKIVLPFQFTKKTNKAVAMDADTITVNNCFGYWITDKDIRCYPDDTRILPTNNNVDVYQYSNAQLKYPPEKSVKIVLKNLLYSNKPVYLDADTNRRSNTNDNVGERSDPNLTYSLVQLKDHVF